MACYCDRLHMLGGELKCMDCGEEWPGNYFDLSYERQPRLHNVEHNVEHKVPDPVREAARLRVERWRDGESEVV